MIDQGIVTLAAIVIVSMGAGGVLTLMALDLWDWLRPQSAAAPDRSGSCHADDPRATTRPDTPHCNRDG